MVVKSYDEARGQFASWRPETKQREGARGMTFDYLPVPDYENYLDETVGAGNWESQITGTANSIIVTLAIFGVSKSSSSSIFPSSKIKRTKKNGEEYFIDNPQPNEVEKAEARAFRRAAARHGLLRYLWEKEADKDSGDESESESRSSGRSTSKPAAKTASKSSGSDGIELSPKQQGMLNDWGVPKSVQAKLTPGYEGTGSALVTALLAAKKANYQEFTEDAEPFVRAALRKVNKSLVPLLDQVDEGDDDNEDDED